MNPHVRLEQLFARERLAALVALVGLLPSMRALMKPQAIGSGHLFPAYIAHSHRLEARALLQVRPERIQMDRNFAAMRTSEVSFVVGHVAEVVRFIGEDFIALLAFVLGNGVHATDVHFHLLLRVEEFVALVALKAALRLQVAPFHVIVQVAYLLAAYLAGFERGVLVATHVLLIRGLIFKKAVTRVALYGHVAMRGHVVGVRGPTGILPRAYLTGILLLLVWRATGRGRPPKRSKTRTSVLLGCRDPSEGVLHSSPFARASSLYIFTILLLLLMTIPFADIKCKLFKKITSK